MGRDKAVLPYRGTTLAGYVAREVQAAAASVMLVGSPERYARLGYPVIADAVPPCGPLGGIVTALRQTSADWNLVVACDMPAISAAFLKQLLEAAEKSSGLCLVPMLDPHQPQPLCAAYHRAALPSLERALRDNILKMRDVVELLEPVYWTVPDFTPFTNINTPEQWETARL